MRQEWHIKESIEELGLPAERLESLMNFIVWYREQMSISYLPEDNEAALRGENKFRTARKPARMREKKCVPP